MTRRPDVFVGVLTERMLTYAVGRARALRHARGAQDRPGCSTDYKFSSIVLGVTRSVPFQMKESAVPRQGDQMSALFKHLSRRTFIRGVGVTMSLPFLDAMVPARTLLAQTAARPQITLGPASSRTAR